MVCYFHLCVWSHGRENLFNFIWCSQEIMHFHVIKKYSGENFGNWQYVFIFMVDAAYWT